MAFEAGFFFFPLEVLTLLACSAFFDIVVYLLRLPQRRLQTLPLGREL